jgi:Kdo2-lipid IVA lauroyltransferase/acyltransferase
MNGRRCILAPILFLPLRLVARLPWPWLMALGAGLGWLLGRLLPVRRRIARRNIELCFPELDERDRERLLAANLRATGIGLMETLAAWFRPSLGKDRHELVGAEFLPPRGQPLLLLSGHFTPMDLGARLVIEALDRPLDLLVRRNNRACVERIVDRGRLRYAHETIAKGDVRALLRALRSGPGVLYAPDQHFRQGAAHLPFFGVPASTLLAAPRLAASAGATIVLGAFRRLDDGRYRLELEPVPADWPRRDAEGFTRRWLEWLELKVRRAPEQYLWVHRRFRSTAPGHAPVYDARDLRGKHQGE